MLLPGRFGSTLEPMPAPFLGELAERVLGLGAGVVGFKLGEDGLYVRTADETRLSSMGRAAPAPAAWANRELWSPVFKTTVEGTVGAGDATYAGFLAALLRGLGLEETVSMANAVGACSVEAADATSGVRSWAETAARVESWPRAPHRVPDGWRRGDTRYVPRASRPPLPLKERIMGPIILPALPAPLVWLGKPADWRVKGEGLTLAAGRETDLFRDPGGAPPRDNAPALLLPTDGDFVLSAKVTVNFKATFDAGVLLLFENGSSWAKLCFERSPQGEPTVVSVVTKGVSDDANAFVKPGPVYLRVARLGRAYAFHASDKGERWELVRYFSLSARSDTNPKVGFLAQSLTGEGSAATFSDIVFERRTLEDYRSSL